MKGECEMGFDFGGVKRDSLSLSLSLSPSLAENELSAENECRCERISCVCVQSVLQWHWLFPSFLKPVVYVQWL
jgi:hypothetical protein